MVTHYLQAVSDAMGGILDLLIRLSVPLAIGLGMTLLAGAVALAFGKEPFSLQRLGGRRAAARGLGYAAVALLVVAGWAGLKVIHPLAREAIRWRESAEATANPIPDAPPVYQFGPAVAALAERTYTRTLTLPPEFLQRVGAEGVGVLAPYLSDPSAENVLRLVDTFRRSGEDVLFTRQVTRLDEEPLPFENAHVRVVFRRLSGRAYDTTFEGRYSFRNAGSRPITARFLFSLPDAGTVRDLGVTVGGRAVPEPNDSGGYEWTGSVAPGERREAVVRYRVLGARAWHYDLGSRRRRVERFRLDVGPGGPVGFLRGSLQPTSGTDRMLSWELDNVVTAQQVALAFPPEIAARDSYLQALSALPAALLVFLAGVLAVGVRLRRLGDPAGIAGAVVLFTFGLGAAPVLANYLGPVAGIILGPLAGAVAASWMIGWRSLLTLLPAALLPAVFLSPQHSGLLALLLALPALAGIALAIRPNQEAQQEQP